MVSKVDHTHQNLWHTLGMRGIPKSANSTIRSSHPLQPLLPLKHPALTIPLPQPRKGRAKARFLRSTSDPGERSVLSIPGKLSRQSTDLSDPTHIGSALMRPARNKVNVESNPDRGPWKTGVQACSCIVRVAGIRHASGDKKTTPIIPLQPRALPSATEHPRGHVCLRVSSRESL
jgi:hypothetical protein